MYYVTPKDCSIARSVGKLETLYEARKSAEALKAQTGANYDIVSVERVWTTQTLDEAHLLSLDIPHMARD